jgi:hypothetical protein
MNPLKPVKLPIEASNKPKLHRVVPTADTIGMLVVAALAARAGSIPAARINHSDLKFGPDQ